MPLRQYIENYYTAACKEQRRLYPDHDGRMVSMLSNGPFDSNDVTTWMIKYSLFMGVLDDERKAIVQQFEKFVEGHARLADNINREQTERLYSELLNTFTTTVPRVWMSATSKLLWCLYPSDVVMYDTFVHRALTVMQRLNHDLSDFPKLGPRPNLGKDHDTKPLIQHYMNYQDMVRKLLSVHSEQLNKLRKSHSESYQYDVRIIDKILWMLGSYSKKF